MICLHFENGRVLPNSGYARRSAKQSPRAPHGALASLKPQLWETWKARPRWSVTQHPGGGKFFNGSNKEFIPVGHNPTALEFYVGRS
jgi:hypothetical protein